MTGPADLLELLDKARKAIGAHDLDRAARGRCNCLPCRSGRLAARGWPNTTTGDGTGVRGTTTSSTTERAATTDDPYNTLNERAHVHLAQLRVEVLAIIGIAAIIDSHASDDDVVPAGTGACGCGCNHICDPRKNPDDRLKTKLAPRCYKRWLRWRNAYPGVTISDYIDACYRERGETRARPVAEARDS